MIGSIIAFVISVAILVLIVKLVFKGTTSIIGFLINAAVGAVILWVLDIVGLGVPITWLTAAIVGFLGVPGVIIVLVLKYIFKLF